MKAATQHKVEHAPGHILARNPSLSTIHEERTSQMYDTPATERTSTADERAEVSFSFDGKEVSVSLYETPDLTEEEALQVVEMYADQLSEHVSGEFCLRASVRSQQRCDITVPDPTGLPLVTHHDGSKHPAVRAVFPLRLLVAGL
jgi:hypothetical protein